MGRKHVLMRVVMAVSGALAFLIALALDLFWYAVGAVGIYLLWEITEAVKVIAGI